MNKSLSRHACFTVLAYSILVATVSSIASAGGGDPFKGLNVHVCGCPKCHQTDVRQAGQQQHQVIMITRTDDNGFFQFKGLRKGRYTFALELHATPYAENNYQSFKPNRAGRMGHNSVQEVTLNIEIDAKARSSSTSLKPIEFEITEDKGDFSGTVTIIGLTRPGNKATNDIKK